VPPCISVEYFDSDLLFVVMVSANVTMANFNMAAKSHDSDPRRVELVFETPPPLHRSSVHRGRSKLDVCYLRGASRTVCRHWKNVRYRKFEGAGHRYCVYDVSGAVASSLDVCYPRPCRFCKFEIFNEF